MTNDTLIDKIKVLSWWWLKAHETRSSFDLNQWWIHSSVCLNFNTEKFQWGISSRASCI
jgi:hypothetical protein